VEVPNKGSIADGLKMLRQNMQADRAPFTGFVSRKKDSDNPPLKESKDEKYCIWTNDVGWLHVATLSGFDAEKKRPRGHEIWGGRATEPLN
jgi:hypothetical protein